jgi:hypothetical protein
VYWGQCNIDYHQYEEIENYFIQDILSRGLEQLLLIINAESYNERYCTLHAEKSPELRWRFLLYALQDKMVDYNVVRLKDFDADEEQLYIRIPFFEELDGGPETVWRWANHWGQPQDFVYDENEHDLRKWGYIFWDLTRTEEIGILRQSPGEQFWGESVPPEELEAAREDKIQAWAAREDIYTRGGRGWWAPGDESKIVWTQKTPPAKRTKTRKRSPPPASLEHAKDILRTLKLPGR